MEGGKMFIKTKQGRGVNTRYIIEIVEKEGELVVYTTGGRSYAVDTKATLDDLINELNMEE